MFAWILQISFISISIIYLVHHLIDFFKSMLTVPKIKDLVENPSKKYKKMFRQINEEDSNNENSEKPLDITNLIPDNTNENPMKRDLKLFLKKQLKSNLTDNITDVFSLDSNYSSYN